MVSVPFLPRRRLANEPGQGRGKPPPAGKHCPRLPERTPRGANQPPPHPGEPGAAGRDLPPAGPRRHNGPGASRSGSRSSARARRSPTRFSGLPVAVRADPCSVALARTTSGRAPPPGPGTFLLEKSARALRLSGPGTSGGSARAAERPRLLPRAQDRAESAAWPSRKWRRAARVPPGTEGRRRAADWGAMGLRGAGDPVPDSPRRESGVTARAAPPGLRWLNFKIPPGDSPCPVAPSERHALSPGVADCAPRGRPSPAPLPARLGRGVVGG